MKPDSTDPIQSNGPPQVPFWQTMAENPAHWLLIAGTVLTYRGYRQYRMPLPGLPVEQKLASRQGLSRMPTESMRQAGSQYPSSAAASASPFRVLSHQILQEIDDFKASGAKTLERRHNQNQSRTTTANNDNLIPDDDADCDDEDDVATQAMAAHVAAQALSVATSISTGVFALSLACIMYVTGIDSWQGGRQRVREWVGAINETQMDAMIAADDEVYANYDQVTGNMTEEEELKYLADTFFPAKDWGATEDQDPVTHPVSNCEDMKAPPGS
jgi:hypothetical protein